MTFAFKLQLDTDMERRAQANFFLRMRDDLARSRMRLLAFNFGMKDFLLDPFRTIQRGRDGISLNSKVLAAMMAKSLQQKILD